MPRKSRNLQLLQSSILTPAHYDVGADKNYIQPPAVIAGGGYGGSYGQGSNLSAAEIAALDEKRNQLAIQRGWCSCLQTGLTAGAIFGGLAALREEPERIITKK
jgi:hypothetical protein